MIEEYLALLHRVANREGGRSWSILAHAYERVGDYASALDSYLSEDANLSKEMAVEYIRKKSYSKLEEVPERINQIAYFWGIKKIYVSALIWQAIVTSPLTSDEVYKFLFSLSSVYPQRLKHVLIFARTLEIAMDLAQEGINIQSLLDPLLVEIEKFEKIRT